MITHTPTAFS